MLDFIDSKEKRMDVGRIVSISLILIGKLCDDEPIAMNVFLYKKSGKGVRNVTT